MDKFILNIKQHAIFLAIIDAILPETDTLGAISLNLQETILKILTECYPVKIHTEIIQAIMQVEHLAGKQFKTSFTLASPVQRFIILKELLAARGSAFVLIRELTIHCFLTSEYILRNFLNYNEEGIGYKGCTPYEPPMTGLYE